jgi:hypothetical protein
MSTYDSPLPIEDHDLRPAENALSNAYSEIEGLAWQVGDIVRAYIGGPGSDEPESTIDPDPLPTYEDIGRLYTFAHHVKHASVRQIEQRADEILDALPTLEDMILNAPKAEAA